MPRTIARVAITLLLSACADDPGEPSSGATTASSGAAGGGGAAGGAGAGGAGLSGSGGMGGAAGPACGNDVKEAGEPCDGDDLGGADCATTVAPGWVGDLGCSPACSGLDTAACVTPASTYHDVSNAGLWQAFDLSALGTLRGYRGGAFDGRYLYFVPLDQDVAGFHSKVIRFDTSGAFADTQYWNVFDVATVFPEAKGFFGAAFDGRYLYLTPLGSLHAEVVRYDTTLGDFDSMAAWSMFDLDDPWPGAGGYLGSAFDGRYLYLVPGVDSGGIHARMVRLDTWADFASLASWQRFDIPDAFPGVVPAVKGFLGAAFDGRYVYLVPRNDEQGPHGRVVRYDTTTSFDAAGTWEMFDVSGVFPGAKGFIGGGFDGRHVYLVPFYDASGPHGRVVRYDSEASFTAGASWQMFDVSTAFPGARGYLSSTFDGRYVYFAPYAYGADQHGKTVRYDTTLVDQFDSAAAWSSFDVESVFGAEGYVGAVFDGRHVYLVPHYDGALAIAVRFDAKTPSWLPKGWNGSFF